MSEFASLLILDKAPDSVERRVESPRAAAGMSVSCRAGDRKVTARDAVSTTADSTLSIDSLTRVGETCGDGALGLTFGGAVSTQSIGDGSFRNQIGAILATAANTNKSPRLEGATL